MLEIKICVDDVDYEALLELLVPIAGDALREKGGLAALAGGNPKLLRHAAGLLLKAKGRSGTEQMIAEIAGKNRQKLSLKLEELAARKGVSLRVKELELRSREI